MREKGRHVTAYVFCLVIIILALGDFASAFLIYKIPLQSLSTMLFAMQGGKIINEDNKII